jgi:hypothetical protein
VQAELAAAAELACTSAVAGSRHRAAPHSQFGFCASLALRCRLNALIATGGLMLR